MRSFTTQRLEPPIRRLAKEFDKVLIRAQYRNTYPRSTLRANDIADLKLRTHTAYAKDRPAVEDWLAKGGVLLNYHPETSFVPDTDAYVFCEAPFSMETFRHLTARTKHVCLIFKPISWEEHRNTVRDLHPPGGDSRRFYDYLKKCKANPKRDLMTFAQALGFTQDGVFAVSDRDVCDDLFMRTENMSAIRKSIKPCITGPQWEYCIPVILRVEPETLEEKLVYQSIKINCPKVQKWNLIDPGKMSRVHRQWKHILKQLARAGNLQREWPVYFYYLTGREPDIEAREQDHQKALADLAEVESFVRSLDVYPV